MRVAGLIYEGILLVPLLFVAGYLFLVITHDAHSPALRALFQAWLLLVLGAYFSYCWVRSGQTLPMKTWRLRLATRDGTPLSRRQAAARFLLAILGLGLFGAGFLWALIDRDGQFLHDRLAGTRIFRTSGPAS